MHHLRIKISPLVDKWRNFYPMSIYTGSIKFPFAFPCKTSAIVELSAIKNDYEKQTTKELVPLCGIVNGLTRATKRPNVYSFCKQIRKPRLRLLLVGTL